jgi:16S rRNA (guanine966-N2)-methyltransferase
LRPTSGKIRETLFNWLQFEIANKTILDPFAGSGALCLEAMSRGAKEVYLIEKNKKVSDKLKSNFKILNSSQYKIINQDSLIFLEMQNKNPFDLVFLDPPFKKNFLPQALKLLSKKNYIDRRSQIYIESEYALTDEILNEHISYQCTISKQKKSGNVNYCLISLEAL